MASIIGTNKKDVLDGTGDDDFIDGLNGNDSINGGGGRDTLFGGVGNDTLFGGLGNDVLRGGAGRDLIDGGDGIDLLDLSDAAQAVNFTLQQGTNPAAKSQGYWSTGDLGGIGNDLYRNMEGVIGSSFGDTITGSSGDDVIIGGAGNDSLNGGEGNDTLYGGAGDDTLNGSFGNDYIDGGDGVDTLDRSVAGNAQNVNLAAGTNGSDIIVNIENVLGSAHNDTITGDGNDNLLVGNAGNDSIGGGPGNDTLLGGAHNDTLTGGGGADYIDGGTTPGINPGTTGDIDLVNYQYAGSAVKVNLSADYNGDYDIAGQTGLVTGNPGDVDTLLNIEWIRGSNFDDILIGGETWNRFEGRGGDDTLVGNVAAQRNEVFYASTATSVVVNLGATDYDASALGLGTVEAGTAKSLTDGTDTLIDIDSIRTGFGDDVLIGNADNNRLRGEVGADYMDGGAGTDEVDYRSSSSGVIVNVSGSAITGNVGFGDQIVQAGTALDGYGGVGSTDTLVSIEDIRGSEFADLLVGSDDANRIRGEGGDDTLVGNGGDDTLDGGAGNDTVSYATAPSAVAVSLSIAGAQNTGGGGNDRLISIERLIGSSHNDSLTGSLGNDVLDGGDGNDAIFASDGDDVLLGGQGNDTLHGGIGADTIDGGNGVDTVDYLNFAQGVTVRLDLGHGGLAGEDTLIAIENVIGSAFNDTLFGDFNANRLEGGDGDDSLNGGAGNDTLLGGAGNDTLNGSFDTDYIDGGDGIDTLNRSGANNAQNVNLAAGTNGADTVLNVENVWGSAFSDTIIGNAADNYLLGNAGNDFLEGRAGNDTLDGGENPGNALADVDVVNYNVAGAGGVNVNLATHTASDGLGGTDTLRNIERVIGTEFDDVLTGGDLSNRGTNASEQFEGRGGNDTITGGSIADGFTTFARYDNSPSGVVINLTSSAIDLDPGAGEDWIDAGTARDGYGTVDTLTNINRIRASAYGDLIYGSDSPDGGNERFEGMAGADTIHGGGGVDYVLYNNSPSAVTVTLLADGSGTASDGFDSDLLTPGIQSYTDAFTGIEGMRGSGFGDVLTGSDRLDVVERFEGMGGNDTITGGLGRDRLEFGQSVSGVLVDLAAGIAYDGFGGMDTLSGIEEATGSRFNDTFIGDAGDNRFDGSEALPGNLPDVDTVNYRMSGATTGVVVNLATGTASDGLGGTDTLINIERVIGTDYDDVLIGGDPANDNPLGSETFAGRGGNDTIDGGSGTDWAEYRDAALGGVIVDLADGKAWDDGDGGEDTLISIERVRGSMFADQIYGTDNAPGTNERFEGMAGADYIDGRGGFDVVHYTSSPGPVAVDLAAGTASDGYGFVDTLVGIEGVRASNFSDFLYGSDNATGTEAFEGMAGNDYIDGRGGNDRVEYSRSTSGVRVDLGAGTASDGFGGTDTLVNIEAARGSIYDDTLIGSAADNVLDGRAGNDILVGGGGADTFEWNAGDQGAVGLVAVDTVIDFDATLAPGTDALDLRDLLAGASAEPNALDAYLDFSFSGGNTTVDVKPAGDSAVTQQIVLQGVDFSTIGTGSDTDIISGLLNSGKLIV